MSKRFWIILIAIIVSLGVVYKLSSKPGNGAANSSLAGSNHVEGKGSTGITLLEYGDYECPYCAQYYPIVNQVQQKFNDQVFFQFKNLPLTQIHQNAFAAARAAEAAGQMGKFWEMHGILYETNISYLNNKKQASWVTAQNPVPYFDAFAKQLGLDQSKFDNYYTSSAVNDLINGDINNFAKTGAEEATPAFFLNGKQIKPQATVDSFSSIIQAAIDKQAKK